MNAATPRLEYSLDIARGLAALWVFLFHLAPMIEISAPALASFATIGSNGVLLFFVVSGYCIHASAARLTNGGMRGVGTFLRRRMRRIYPPFWLSLLVVLALPYVVAAISMLKSGAFEWPERAAWSDWDLFDWLGLLTLTRGLATGESGDSAFNAVQAVYWTLAIEVQFYLVVALAMCAGRRWRIVLWAVTLAAALVVVFRIHVPGGTFVQFWPHFAFGMVLHVMHEHEATLPGDGRLLTLILACSGLLLIAIGIHLVGRPLAYAFSLTCAAVLWLSGHIEDWIRKHWGSGGQHRALRIAGRSVMTLPLLLGASSYSVYLLHGKLYQVPAMFVRQVVPPDSVFHALFVIVLTCALCYLFYLFAERPFIRTSTTARLVESNAMSPSAAPPSYPGAFTTAPTEYVQKEN